MKQPHLYVPVIVRENTVRSILLFNSLHTERKEVVTVRIHSPNVRVSDSAGKTVEAQVRAIKHHDSN